MISNEFTSLKPILSPDMKKILYFGSQETLHNNLVKIKYFDLDSQKNIDVTNYYDYVDEEMQFAGYSGNFDVMRNTFWLNDSKHIIFSS